MFFGYQSIQLTAPLQQTTMYHLSAYAHLGPCTCLGGGAGQGTGGSGSLGLIALS